MKMILITAIWCPSCIIMRPKYMEIAKTNGYEYVELDFDNDDISNYNPGKTLPICIIYNELGSEIKRVIGEKSNKELRKVFS